MSDIFGRGVYTFGEVARLTGLPTRRVWEWFRGRNPNADRPTGRPALFSSDHAPIGDVQAVSFLDLADVFVAGQLREYGVTLPTVRRVYARLQTDFGTVHPFARKELLTDGKKVFVQGEDSAGEKEIYDALTKQKAFPLAIEPFLKRIDYSPMTALAVRWRIAEGVVLDPGISFGRPVLQRSAIPTYVVAAAYKANGRDADAVAGWYDLTSTEVMDAVRYEFPQAA